MNAIRAHLTQPNRHLEQGRMSVAATEIFRSSNDQLLAFQKNIERLREQLYDPRRLIDHAGFETRFQITWEKPLILLLLASSRRQFL